jgi:hypothetical protein
LSVPGEDIPRAQQQRKQVRVRCRAPRHHAEDRRSTFMLLSEPMHSVKRLGEVGIRHWYLGKHDMVV